MKKTRHLTIEGHQISPHDRYVISFWCGYSLPQSGDVSIPLRNQEDFRGLQELLEMLGKGKAPAS